MRVQLYCDGGCRGNQKRENVGGWGVVLIWGEHVREMHGGRRDTTNNVMELTAAIEGLRAIHRKDVGVDVYTDSSYVQNGMNAWIRNWMAKGWVNSQGKPVANRKLWEQLHALASEFDDIRFHKVKGHAGLEGNERADELANQGMDEVQGPAS